MPVVISDPAMQNGLCSEEQFVTAINPGVSITLGRLDDSYAAGSVITPTLLQTTANPTVTLDAGTVSENNDFGNAPLVPPEGEFPCIQTGQTFSVASDTPNTLLVGAGLNTTTFRISQISANCTNFLAVPVGGSQSLTLPNGTLVVDSDGAYSYTASNSPANPFPSGPSDTFMYKLVSTTSGAESFAQTWNLPPVELPLVVNNDSFQVDATGFASGNVLSGDRDPDGDPLTVAAVNSTWFVGLPTYNPTTVILANGVLNINTNGTFWFQFTTSAATQTFTYTVADLDGCTGSATVTINRSATLSGFVYVDLNDNGHKDDGEPVFSNATATLFRKVHGAWRKQAVTTTDSAGFYKFSDLAMGTYKIVEGPPTGWRNGKNSVGTVDGKPHGQTGGNTITHIVLTWGNAGINYDFAKLPSQGVFTG
jgi:hypothetical protein